MIFHFYLIYLILNFGCLVLCQSSNYTWSAKIIFYYGPNFQNNQAFELGQANDILSHPRFDRNIPTALYLHGYQEYQTSESASVIVEAYYKGNSQNLLILDWAEEADGDYLTNALLNTRKLGPDLAKVLNDMFDSGLNLRTFHLVGHSLGGQLAGIIGRELTNLSNRKLARITGLDPASIGFYLINQRLNSADGEFVDIIHTDAWIYGYPFSTGTADFWPNGGTTLQPGCPIRNFQILSDNDLCSHRRSWRFWAESVSRQYQIEFLANNERNLKPVHMGLDCPTNIHGNFYLTTNAVEPYAKGTKGLIYESGEGKTVLSQLFKHIH